MSIKLTFCGGTSTVTGSCYWIRHSQGQFLIDCGLFQGTKSVKELNYNEFPFDPKRIDFVLLTHAHIDHSGLLPKLVKKGFKGPIYATAPTRDLLTYMLPDSAYIQESEVGRLNRRNRQRGHPPVEPIYTRQDVSQCLSQFSTVVNEDWKEVAVGIRTRYWNAGHILGAGSIELEMQNGNRNKRTLRLLFSGDIGPENKLFQLQPEAPEDLDYIICESTYGSRKRSRVTETQRRKVLLKEVSQALKRGGNLIIPAFAVERTQELLLDLSVLVRDKELPDSTIFLDSPLAIRATKVFAKYAKDLEDVSNDLNPFGRSQIHFTESVDESKGISFFKEGAIIIAASGMCDAGRIRHHLIRNLPDRKSTVLLVGYQAPGSMGRLLTNGVRRVRIHGEEVVVRATIRSIDTYSAHADQQGLIDWILKRQPPKRGLFLTHGEDESRIALRDTLVKKGLQRRSIYLPELDDVFDLLGHGGPRKKQSQHRLSNKLIGKPDWHNDYAEFTLELQKILHSTSDDIQRTQLLRRLRRNLDS